MRAFLARLGVCWHDWGPWTGHWRAGETRRCKICKKQQRRFTVL